MKIPEEWKVGSVWETSPRRENLSSDPRTYMKSLEVAQHSWKPCTGDSVGRTGRSLKIIGQPVNPINELFIARPCLKTTKVQVNKGKEPNLDSRPSNTCTPCAPATAQKCTHTKK